MYTYIEENWRKNTFGFNTCDKIIDNFNVILYSQNNGHITVLGSDKNKYNKDYFQKIFLKEDSFFGVLFIYLFIFGCVRSSLLCTRAFSSCGEQGLLFVVVRRLLLAVASHCRARALGAQASVVVAHGLSCSVACGIFPDQGSNLYPLHWQADSQPLGHQGSPYF